jgi:hypothetical protein
VQIEGGFLADGFKAGDRVGVIRSGEQGKILRVDGHLAHIQLDNNLRQSVVKVTPK